MTTKFPSDKQDKFMLRLPDGMRDRIAVEAEKNGRSMNAEVVQRLQDSFGLAEKLQELEIGASADRIHSAVMVMTLKMGNESAIEQADKFVQSMIRTPRDIASARRLADELKAAASEIDRAQAKTAKPRAPGSNKKPKAR